MKIQKKTNTRPFALLQPSLGKILRTHAKLPCLVLVEAFINLHDHAYFLLSVFLVGAVCPGREFVRLQNLSGTAIEAQILAFQNGRVQLKRKDGVAFVVSISIFNEASKALIMAKHGGEAGKFRQRIGKPVEFFGIQSVLQEFE